MRQVFTSPRLANVEAVAQLLEDAGIATKISNGRSYRGRFDRGMSYRDTGNADQAAVWVIRSEDQPRARAMLREAGLLDSTRPDQQRDSFLPEHLRAGGAEVVPGARWLSPGRLKVLLLIAIALVMAMVALWQRRPDSSSSQAAGNTSSTATQPRGPGVLAARNAAPIVQRVDVPSALAVLLLARAAGERGIADACVEIDGSAPSARVTELLAGIDDAPRLAEAARCGEGSTLARIRIDDYQTDGSGTGSVRMRVQRGAMRVDQRFEVVREGYDWRITGSSRP